MKNLNDEMNFMRAIDLKHRLLHDARSRCPSMYDSIITSVFDVEQTCQYFRKSS